MRMERSPSDGEQPRLFVRWQENVEGPVGEQAVDRFEVAKQVGPWGRATMHPFRPAAEAADADRVRIDDFDPVITWPQHAQKLACREARTFREKDLDTHRISGRMKRMSRYLPAVTVPCAQRQAGAAAGSGSDAGADAGSRQLDAWRWAFLPRKSWVTHAPGPVVRKNIVCTPLDNPVPHGDNRCGEQLLSQQGAFAIMTCPRLCRHLVQLVGTVLILLGDSGRFLGLCVRSHAALAAENLFLRKQLALYQERHVKPRRATDAV